MMRDLVGLMTSCRQILEADVVGASYLLCRSRRRWVSVVCHL